MKDINHEKIKKEGTRDYNKIKKSIERDRDIIEHTICKLNHNINKIIDVSHRPIIKKIVEYKEKYWKLYIKYQKLNIKYGNIQNQLDGYRTSYIDKKRIQNQVCSKSISDLHDLLPKLKNLISKLTYKKSLIERIMDKWFSDRSTSFTKRSVSIIVQKIYEDICKREV